MLGWRPEDTRIRNVLSVLHLLLKHETVTRVDLSRMTGLTKTTVSSIVKQMIDHELVKELPATHSGNVGKTPIPLSIRSGAVYTLGAHVGRRSVRTVLLDAKRSILLNGEELPYERLNQKHVLKTLFHAIEELLKSAKQRGIEVKAIGVGIPGPLDVTTGVVKHPPKFRGWNNVALGKMLKERYERQIWIENDANVAALAEKWHGGGQKFDKFMYVLANEGIGAGLVIDGELYQGAYDYVGELGHVLFRIRGRWRYLEDISGLDCLLKRIRSYGISVTKASDVASSLHSCKAKSAVREIMQLIGVAIVNAIHVVGPEAVFIGGEMAALEKTILEPVREVVQKYLFGKQNVEVHLSQVKGDAVSIGAGIYAAKKYLERKCTEELVLGK